MKISNSNRIGLIAALVVACAVAAPAALAKNDNQPIRILSEPAPNIAGPKRTIAVGQIDMIAPYANPSQTNVGGALAAMLTTALAESGRFIVVERDALSGVVTEQELTKAGVSTGAGPTPGRIIPVQYLVVGSVTEFTTPGAGKGGGLTVAGLGGGVGGVTLGRSKGVVALDLRIVDTRTSAVVKAFKVRRDLASTTVGLTGSYKGMPVATNQFFNTPLGDATRRALNDAVRIIATSVGEQSWRGQVVEVEGGQVYVNAGAEAGLAAGSRLKVERVGQRFTDPTTGQVLSERMADIGYVTIRNVEPKLSSGNYQPLSGDAPGRGDIVVLEP